MHSQIKKDFHYNLFNFIFQNCFGNNFSLSEEICQKQFRSKSIHFSFRKMQILESQLIKFFYYNNKLQKIKKCKLKFKTTSQSSLVSPAPFQKLNQYIFLLILNFALNKEKDYILRPMRLQVLNIF